MSTDNPTDQSPPDRPPARPAHPPAAPAPVSTDSELERRRNALAEEVTELHWDLGGLAYEMAIRDHFRLDVIVRRAAVLQERDAELAEIERLLKEEREGAVGRCPNCSAPHSRGALFCWQCGTQLMERKASTAVPVAADAARPEGDPPADATASNGTA